MAKISQLDIPEILKIEFTDLFVWLDAQYVVLNNSVERGENGDDFKVRWDHPVEIFYPCDIHSTMMFLVREMADDKIRCELGGSDELFNAKEETIDYFIARIHALGHAILAKTEDQIPELAEYSDSRIADLLEEYACLVFALILARKYFKLKMLPIKIIEILSNIFQDLYELKSAGFDSAVLMNVGHVIAFKLFIYHSERITLLLN